MASPLARPSLAVALVLALGPASACTGSEGDGTAPQEYAGLFSPEEVRSLHARWDYVRGWFGGDLMRFGHLNVDALVPTVPLRTGGAPRPLAETPRPDVATYLVETRDRGPSRLDDYVAGDRRVDGLLVLHRGAIVYERYVGMRPTDRHLWWSTSKIVTGVLISRLEDEGLLDVSQTVDHYVPWLASSGWAGITIRNVLDMASGIDCPETAEAYDDIESCMLVMERTVGLQPELPTLSFREHMAGMHRAYDQGTRYEYASANTSLLMALAEEVTGQRYPDLVSDRVWRNVGADGEARLVSGDYGRGEAAAAHGGMFTTLRDLGRLGLLLLDDESFQRKVLEDGRPSLFSPEALAAPFEGSGEAPIHAAWQTDVVFADGDFGKGGWGGQFLYVSPSRDLVIAWFGTFGEDLVEPDLRSIARQLATAPGLWPVP